MNEAEMLNRTRGLFKESIDLKKQVMENQLESVVAIATTVASSLRQGGKILLCGNGGSAADAQHLAAELLVRLRPHIKRDGIPAIALAMDSSSMTACGNDYGFDTHFERMARALGKPGDVLIGISTSGESTNVFRALRTASEKGMVTIGLLGCDGGLALPECDVSLVVPSDVTGRVQEVHITIGHAVLELVEEILIDDGYLTLEEEQ